MEGRVAVRDSVYMNSARRCGDGEETVGWKNGFKKDPGWAGGGTEPKMNPVSCRVGRSWVSTIPPTSVDRWIQV